MIGVLVMDQPHHELPCVSPSDTLELGTVVEYTGITTSWGKAGKGWEVGRRVEDVAIGRMKGPSQQLPQSQSS